MNAVKTFFINYLKAIAECRQENVTKTAQYLTWHVLVIFALNIIALVVSAFTSLIVFGCVALYSLGALFLTFLGMGVGLTFNSQEDYLKKVKRDCLFEDAGIHAAYYALGLLFTLILHSPKLLTTSPAQVEFVSLPTVFAVLLSIYAICLASAFICQWVRIKVIPAVRSKVNKATEGL